MFKFKAHSKLGPTGLQQITVYTTREKFISGERSSVGSYFDMKQVRIYKTPPKIVGCSYFFSIKIAVFSLEVPNKIISYVF
jgi:hypothetical protein